jgi:hypothetical protein
MLQGRQSERQLLERQLERARRGQSAVRALRGEAGIGKTALLDDDASAGPTVECRSLSRREPVSGLRWCRK